MKKKLYCCERCQVYWTCGSKWYRGEQGAENICCPVCNFYAIYHSDKNHNHKSEEKKTSKKIKPVFI